MENAKRKTNEIGMRTGPWRFSAGGFGCDTRMGESIGEQIGWGMRRASVLVCSIILLLCGSVCTAAPGEGIGSGSQGAGAEEDLDCDSANGSPYIVLDYWVNAAVMRLYSLGFVDQVYLGMRPWTRASLGKMMESLRNDIDEERGTSTSTEAKRIYDALDKELRDEVDSSCSTRAGRLVSESGYTTMRGISGTPLRDSFHLGSTVVNDYGRPYAGGLNTYSGASGFATWNRFAVYVRGEFQSAPSSTGFNATLSQTLSAVDLIPFLNPATGLPYNQPTIPLGPIGAATQGRLMEAYVSAQYLNHVISFGKQDDWLGPAVGGGMAYSNNAENIYSFRINRVEPLEIPLLSRLTGPFRYDFLVGPLRGHTLVRNPSYDANPSPGQPNVINPGDPWVHLEKISMKPFRDFEIGFERTAIWGGEGHVPITLHSFLRSFVSLTAPSPQDKEDRNDPGARFAAFDFSWRLPYLRNWLTLYSDSEVHDDVSPIDAPRHGSWRPGLYLSHLPGTPRFDLRVEGVYTDPPVARSVGGEFMYWEQMQKQGYTNQGQLFGDWIGREDKGGQAWMTWHLSGDEWIQGSFRHQKAAKDFIPGGTTLNDLSVQVVKRIRKDLEIKGSFTWEKYKAPIYQTDAQGVAVTTVQLTWFPGRKVNF